MPLFFLLIWDVRFTVIGCLTCHSKWMIVPLAKQMDHSNLIPRWVVTGAIVMECKHTRAYMFEPEKQGAHILHYQHLAENFTKFTLHHAWMEAGIVVVWGWYSYLYFIQVIYMHLYFTPDSIHIYQWGCDVFPPCCTSVAGNYWTLVCTLLRVSYSIHCECEALWLWIHLLASLLWAAMLCCFTSGACLNVQTCDSDDWSRRSRSATDLARAARASLPPRSIVPINQKAICDAALNPSDV